MHLLKNKILQSSAINVLFSGGSNVFNYVFVLVCINYLTPREYSDLALIISFYSIIGIFSATLATTSLSILSRENSRSEKEKIMSLAKFLVLTLSVFSIFILTPFIAHFFDVGSYINIATILIAGVLSIVTSLLTVHFQIMGQFTRNGFSQVLGTIFKLALSFAALYLGFGLFGISASLLLTTILIFILFYPREEYPLLIKSNTVNIFKVSIKFIKNNRSLLEKSLLSSLVAILCITLDTIMAKKILSPDIAAQFIGMSVVAKLFIYGTLAITTVIFPYILSVKQDQKKYIQYLNLFILFTGFIWILISYLFGELLISLILGAKYISLSYNFYLLGLVSVSATLAYANSHLVSLLDLDKSRITYAISLAYSIIGFIILSPDSFTSLSHYLISLFAFISLLLYYMNINNYFKRKYEANKYNSPLL